MRTARIVRAPRNRPGRVAAVCVAASVAVHAAAVGYLVFAPVRPPRLTDSPPVGDALAETVLTLTKSEPTTVERPPEVAAPQPDPEPVPTTESGPVAPRVAVATEATAPVPEVERPRAIVKATPMPPPRDEEGAVDELSVASSPKPAARAQTREPSAAVGGGAVFAGVAAARAGRIVYAVDASGAMASSLPFVMDELRRSVSRLLPSQRFQVVLFRESVGGEAGVSTLVFAPEPVEATAENVSRLSAFLAGVRPAGRSNPLAGLEPALAQRPDLVFLLTRSIRRSGPVTDWGPGNRAVMARLGELNPKGAGGVRPVVIKTIQFLDPDPTGLLQAIADEHGDGPGSSRTVRVEEMQ